MGLVKKPKLEDYWAQESVLDTPFFRKHMSRNTFKRILSNFHVANNDIMPRREDADYDPLYKIRSFLDICKDNFRGLYYPEKELALDEGGCSWKGRGGSKVYNPNKPNKFSIKIYEVCESQSGYVVGFEVYSGASNENGHVCDPGSTKITQLVMRLLDENRLLGVGHQVYTDNWYTSPELAQELYARDTYLCGTVRKNRKGLPRGVTLAKLKKGESVFRRNENTLALKWVEKKRPVYMLSTIHAATQKQVKVSHTGESIIKPVVVADYIKNMLGVDLNDQMLTYYSMNRRCTKWWKKLFVHFVGMIMTNSYILHRKFHTLTNNARKVLTHAEYITAIIKYLIEEGSKTRTVSPRIYHRHVGMDRLTGRHFPCMIQDGSTKRKTPSRKCHVCSRVSKETSDVKQRHWTSFWCQNCKVPLCVNTHVSTGKTCFELYHTKDDFVAERLIDLRPQINESVDNNVSQNNDVERQRIEAFLNTL